MLGAEEPVMAASALARCGATLRLVVVALLLLLAGCGGGGGSGGSAASPAQSAPPQPTGFTAQAGDGEVALTWTALSAATGWEYRQRSEGGGWGAWTAIGGSGAATAGHTVTGLENGTAYGFQVRAVNAGGAGPASAEATATPDVPGVPVEIPDANLRRVLEQALGRSSGETITDADLRTLRILQAQGEGIANLTGLEHATGLTRLELDRNRVSDLAPLAMLTSLDRLYLSYNDVVDLEPLSGLGSLSWLLLEGNRVSDLAPLSSLTSLTNLNLTRNRVSDLSALAGLRELWALGVYENQASNLSPLAELTSLEFLNVGYNGVVDLQPLAGLTSLRELSAHINEIADLSPLRGLRFLEYLLLDNNPVEDAEPLSALTSMRYLSLEWFRAVDDLSFVSGMSELTYLDLQRTSVRDLGPLSALSELERLVISDTLVEDLSPLADLPSLQQLFIHNLRVDLEPLSGLESLRTLGQWSSTTGAEGPKVDIAPLAGLRNLERLTASPSHGDLSPLADLRSLQFLYLGEPGAPFEGLASLSGLSELRELTLEGGGLDEISALADLTALERLNLSGNRIEELAPLTGLESLSDLDLDDNRVVEVAPLAANPGLGTGDTVSLVGNPLGAEALRTHIPELESRGATVAYDRDDFPDSPLRVLHDGAVSMLVDADLDTVRWELDLEAYAQEFIAHFGDEFDVLLLLSALASPQDHADAPYYGYYHHVSSDVRGIGQGDPGEPLPNAMRLKGLIHFPWLNALVWGPSLHELMHTWANYGVRTADGTHWGFSSADGQLGGFRLENLVDLGGGRWSAGRFGTNANGANGVPYSPWELYLGGFIGPEEVPDLWHAPEGRWTGERTAEGHYIFEAVEPSTLTIDDFIATHGAREPDSASAPKELRGAVIVLEDDDHRLHDWNDLLEQVRWLSHPSPDYTYREKHNYYRATGGRGRLVLEGLRALRRETPLSDVPALRLETVCTLPGAKLGVAPRLLNAPVVEGPSAPWEFDGGLRPDTNH